MYLLKVIPIVKGLPENYFSYFHTTQVLSGALVEVKIRNRKILSIVCEIEEVLDKKVNIKSEKFVLKKIERVVLNNFLSEEVFKSISTSSPLIGVKESDILENYLPEFVFENLNILENRSNNENKNIDFSFEFFMGNFEERIKIYKEIIATNFKDKKSTLIFFPTINDLEFTKKVLDSTNFSNIVYFHSAQTKKELKENLSRLKEEKNFLILSTPSLFPFLIKNNISLETVVLEKENSFNYFTHTSKKQIDARVVVKNIVRDLKLQLVLAGNILSLETFKEAQDLRKNEKNAFSDFRAARPEGKSIFSFFPDTHKNNFEIISLAKDKIKKEALQTRIKKIKEEKDKNIEKYSPVYFSEELVQKLEKIRVNKGKAFLYAKRKGMYTETICADCNTIFKCEKCDKPYTLFKKENGERIYICSNCKDKIELKKSENLTCKNCGSWRMNTLGVGVEGIEENLKEVGFKTFLLDSSNVKTKKDINKILDDWQKEGSSILIGTDLALNFLNKDFDCDLGAIISLDSLFSIPEINIDEKIFNICLELKERINTKEKIQEKIIIQTRLPEQSVWEYIKDANTLGFLDEEIKTRKMLSLPPFSNILKWRLDKKEIKMKADIEKILDRIFKEEEIERQNIIYRIDKKTGNQIATLIIKKEAWQKKEKDGKLIPSQFAKKVTALLSDFKLEINPPNIY